MAGADATHGARPAVVVTGIGSVSALGAIAGRAVGDALAAGVSAIGPVRAFPSAVELVARDLQEERHVAQQRVRDECLEAGAADETVADVLMQVAAGAELRLRVVAVDGRDVLGADLALQFVHRRGDAVGRADVIAGGERMAGIDADLRPRIADALEDLAEVGELRADGATLAGGVLEDHPRIVGCFGQDVLRRLADLLEDGFEAEALVAAGVEDDAARADTAGDVE